ncbi:hypothetical protein BGX34_004812, partial [Mortierella sp. NVP85]
VLQKRAFKINMIRQKQDALRDNYAGRSSMGKPKEKPKVIALAVTRWVRTASI